MSMQHIMIDLETLGTKPNSVFVSIGAVAFDLETGEIGETFGVNVDWQSSLNAGRVMDANTIQWWLGQEDDARKAILTPGTSLGGALTCFRGWMKQGSLAPIVWGNGATFDISMLENAYHGLGLLVPWKYYNVRDVRTIRMLAEDICGYEVPEFTGIKHNAMHDALHQAKYVIEMYRRLSGKYYPEVK